MHSSLLKFMVNNKPVEVEIVPGEMLVDVLRKKLKLTGTKVGCNEAECGACTVVVDGKPILSCSYPAEKVSGRSVITIEGLAHNGKLHNLQQEFVIKGAVQCGFCIPGQIMTAYGLLQEHPKPSQEAIRTALKDTLCRCGGYPSIEKAIRSALNDDTLPATSDDIPAQSRFEHRIIGKIVQRPDATAKVTGAAIYTDDLTFPGMLFGGTKRAMVAHGILKRINLDSAKCIPGVRAILTAVDIPGNHYHGLVVNDWPVLVGIGERIRYEGDAIALVAAESPDILQEALNSIRLEIDELPVVTDPKISMGCPNLHPNGNLLKHIKVNKGDIEKGFEEADLIFEDTFKTVSTDHAFIEPECSIARLAADGRMEIYVGSQIPYADRNQVAKALGWGDDRVRIIGMLIGGGFGGKEDITGQIHAALLTYFTRLPVKILYTRHESLLVHPKRHATQIKVKLGSTSAGKLVAMQTELYGDTGAYASLGEKVMTRATTHSSGPYEAENVKADCYAVYTNNPPAGAFRGFGVTQSTFAIETMMDVLAEKISVDPIHLRKMNALKVGSVTNTGQTLTESVGLLECLDKVEHELKHLGESKPFIGKNVAEQPFLRSAWGIAAAYKNTGLGGGAPDKAGAEIELLPEGVFEVRTSSAEIGQGLVTVLQMIASEELGFSLEHIRVLLSDTDLTPDGGPTTASRQTYVTGNAVRHAAGQLRNALLGWIAEIYDVCPGEIHFVEGLVQVGKQLIPLKDITREICATDILPKVQYEYWAPKTLPLGNGGDMHFAYSYAVQAAHVQVDIRYGIVTVKKVISALDVGSIINPLGLIGQIEGGIMMGLGNALLENFITENGRIITDRLAKYRIPSIIHTPEIISHIIEHPTAEGPYGAKGVGEIVSIPTTPAITNAIYNAVGVRIRQLPVDQEYIALEIQKAWNIMIIHNGKIVTWEKPNQILTGYGIAIKEGVIAAIAPQAELIATYPEESLLDAHSQFIMPGNICAHTHFYGAYARGLAIPGPAPDAFPAILKKLWWPLDKALTLEDVYYSTLVCLIDAVKHGTTSLIDHHASPNAIRGSLDTIAAAVSKMGVRAALCYEVTDRDGEQKAHDGIRENGEFFRAVKTGKYPRGKIGALFGLHASLTLTDSTLGLCRESIEPDAGIHIHVAEHPVDEYDSIEKSGLRVVERLAKHGLLNRHSILAHAVHIDMREIEIIAAKDCWVTHQPRSNMNNAVGLPRVEEMLRLGIKVGLGNDGFSNAMWEEWKIAYLAHKLIRNDPRRMNGLDIIEMAVNQNSNLVTEIFDVGVIGKLIPGALADIIFVEYHPYTPLTADNLPWHMIFGFHESMITTTIVDGIVLMKDRKLLWIDEEEITQKALALSPGVWQRYQEINQTKEG